MTSFAGRWRKAVLLILLAYALSGAYFVAPEEQAVVTRFDRVVAAGIGPGLHYHWPWPVEQAARLKVLETKRLAIGAALPDRLLGRSGPETPALYLTGDQNIITAQVAVQYAIRSPVEYLYRSREVERMLGCALEAAFASALASEPVDELLTTGKVALQNATVQQARQILDAYGVGVSLHSVNIEQIGPSAEVADAFRDVASARADRTRVVNEANGYAYDAVARAHGEADKMKSEAGGFRQQRINEARGDADRFLRLLAEAGRARDLTEKRLYLESMEEILPRIKKVLIDPRAGRNGLDLGIIRGER